jgi:cob(I)alamin adenosyltransferase
VAVSEEGVVKIGQYSLAYLNRLSSLLYALARLSNYKSGIKEEAPSYK